MQIAVGFKLKDPFDAALSKFIVNGWLNCTKLDAIGP